MQTIVFKIRKDEDSKSSSFYRIVIFLLIYLLFFAIKNDGARKEGGERQGKYGNDHVTRLRVQGHMVEAGDLGEQKALFVKGQRVNDLAARIDDAADTRGCGTRAVTAAFDRA